MNLRVKIHITSACLILIVVMGMMTSLYLSEKKQLLVEVRQEQKDDLAKLESVYEEAMLAANEVILFNYVKTLGVLPKVAYAGFIEKGGSGWIHAGGNTPLVFADVNDPHVSSILKSGKFLRRNTMSPKKERVIEISKPIRNKAYVRLAYSEKVVNRMITERLEKSLRKLTVVGFIAILFGLILAQFLSRYLSGPINDLMGAAQKIAEGDKGVTIQEGGRDELGQLTRTFNHMSKELVKLDELKDEFMSHVTHELRSPLTSIIATVELMDEMPMADSNPKIRRSIDRLKYGSERLNKLVDNILDLTRMEAGKMQFDIQPSNIGTAACEMVDFFEPRAMEKNLYVRSDVPRSLPAAMADVEKIRQVLSNLIHNAIKFTNEGGITVWVREKNGLLHVGVTDTGIGIPKEKLKSVFSKFETLKDSKDRVNKPVPGSGLGLNIVLNSIQNQGGKIWVESEVDQGTTFTFTLPIAKNHPKMKTERNEIVKDAEKKTPQPEKAVRPPVMMKRSNNTV